jgi:hypothetical protein
VPPFGNAEAPSRRKAGPRRRSILCPVPPCAHEIDDPVQQRNEDDQSDSGCNYCDDHTLELDEPL